VKSPLEICLFFILVLAIVVGSILLYRYRVKKSTEDKFLKAQRLFDAAVIKKGVNEAEREVLERLAGYMKRSEEKNLLFEKKAVFNACIKKLLMEEKISPSLLASIRLKLGFNILEDEQIPHSSAELPLEMPVMIVQKGSEKKRGRIVSVNQDTLSIEIDDASRPPRPEIPVSIVFENPSGQYSFTTSIKKVGKGVINVAHSEAVERFQRRRFYRKKLFMPVYVKRTGSQEQYVLTTIKDLGGGGASITNPEKRFVLDDKLSLAIFTPGRKRINLTATVVRVSDDGETLHLNFGEMPESSRDRIIRFLLQRKGA
jgi:c-di-GMP-binding flagellar brake protein YcgR